MNQIIPYTYEGNNIRTLTTEDGELRFVLADLAAVLDIMNVTQLRSRLSDDLCQTYPVPDRRGQVQQTWTVNEPGLYEVIIRSDKPEATQFRRWVTSEVLPSIRKRGGYLTPEATREALRDPDFIIQLAMDLKEERARAAQAEAARAKAEAEVEAQRPVAALGKAIETAEGDLTPSAFGKILSKTHKDMGPNKFCRWLLDNNFAFRNGQGKIIPMQDAVNRGILILTERIDPAGKIRPQLLVTPAGQSYFAGILGA